jgi:HSP20 family molecular chaperone IbpA
MSPLRESLRNLPDTVFADLLESEDAYRLVIDAAGVAPESLDVSVERGRLTVNARREKEVPPDFRYRAEERALFLDFEVLLPPDATTHVESTDVDRGVVTVTVAKRGEESGVPVPVDSDAADRSGADQTAGDPVESEGRDRAGSPPSDGDDEYGNGTSGARE